MLGPSPLSLLLRSACGCLCHGHPLLSSAGFPLVPVSTPGLLTCGAQGSTSPCTAISKAAASLPGSQQAWLLSASFQGSNILLGWCPPNSSCSFPVVLLAEGMLRWGGGSPSPWLLFPLLHQLTAKYPWGLVREGFSLIFFFSNGNNSTTCQRDFCMHLFWGEGGLTSSLLFSQPLRFS